MTSKNTTKEKKEFINDPDKLAEGFLFDYFWSGEGYWDGKQGYTLRYYQSEFYLWNDGRFYEVKSNSMKVLVKRYLHDLNLNDEAEPIRITANLINNIIICIAGMEHVDISDRRDFNSWHDGREVGFQTISFKNGLLLFGHNGDEPELVPPSPYFFTLVQVPYDYDDKAECPKWIEFLMQVMDDDIERCTLLMEWAGYLLTNNVKHHKFLLATGEGGNGKGVLFDVLEMMVGRENCSHVPLARFGDRFALATTIGKLANMSSESESAIDGFGETVLKSFTAGDSMSFERKFSDPVESVPTAKVMLATNSLPKFKDKTQGIWRRMLFVPFDRTFEEVDQNKNLAKELSTELSGIFNWALRGQGYLETNGQFTAPVRCTNAIEDYKREINPARAFLQDNFGLDLGVKGTPSQEVYTAYKIYCEDNGRRPMNSANFGKEVSRTLNCNKIRTGKGQNRVNIYEGLRLLEDSTVENVGFLVND